MVLLKSVPHSHCWWERCLGASGERHTWVGGDPTTIPSYGYDKPYRSVVPWHEGECERRPQRMAPLGKAMPCLEPRLPLGKPLIR